MSAADRPLRFRTAMLLLQEYGPTMTVENVRDKFFPSAILRTVTNKATKGDLPPRRNGVFDTQEIGDWWDDLCTGRAPRAA